LITVVENPTSIAQIELISSQSVSGEIKAKAGKTQKLLYFKNHRKYKLRFYRNPSFDGWVHFRKILVLHLKCYRFNGIVSYRIVSNFILHSGRWSL
jgi:hypothetical protein